MNSEGNFNVYLYPWKFFHLKVVEALLFWPCQFPGIPGNAGNHGKDEKSHKSHKILDQI